MKFSNSQQVLINPEWRADYESAGTWPNDALDITNEQKDKIIAALSRKASVLVSSSGLSITEYERTKADIDSDALLAKAALRAMREPMLDALAGIAGRATRAGNDALAAEADALSEQLLDITDDPALNAATDYESMQAAGVAAYKRIAASASDDLKVVFREITGV